MAISSSVVWEVRSTATGGANVNGGGFKTGASGTDFSQQNGAQFALTGVTSAGAGDTFLTAQAAESMVGNIVNVVSGTNFTVGRYEIIAVSVGVSVQVDRAITTGAGADGVLNIGGALSLTSSDDAIFETFVPGNKVWIKQGTYTIGGSVNVAAAGSVTSPIVFEGYASARGDKPTGATRPTFNLAANSFVGGDNRDFYNLIVTGTAAAVFTLGANSKAVSCKFSNTSGTAGRAALVTGVDSFINQCEANSTAGIAISITANDNITICGSYIHDSDIGISVSSATARLISISNVLDTFVTAAYSLSTGITASTFIWGNTIYGAETPAGIGVSLATGTTDVRILNSIIYGFVTGVSHADSQTVGFDDYNDYYNNTTDVTNWTKGSNSIARNPQFGDAANANFNVGTLLRDTGSPSTYPGSGTSSYIDIGAASTQLSGERRVNHLGPRKMG